MLPYKGMGMMSKYTAAYLAGLLDGEGYVSIWEVKKGQKKKWLHTHETYYHPVIKIVMTDEPIIRWLKDSFGGTLEVRRLGEKNINWKTSYGWMLRKAQVVEFLRHVSPYLRVKKQQAEIILEFSKLKSLPFIPMSEEAHEKKYQLYKQIRILNKRGAV
jgi:hypothetical protein